MVLKTKSLDKVRETVPTMKSDDNEIVRVNLNVPKHIRAKWKIAATERGVSITDLINEAVNEYLSR